jgi:TolB-like protein/Tfp pilus assembly protein PilF
MGVHSGPVSGVIDVNDHANLAGAGINMAQRVMACGDAGHILVSKHVAEDLEEYEHWRPLLHDLGTCEVKHGMRVGIANLYADQVGNPQLPKKFQALKKRSVRLRWTVAMAMLLALAAIIVGFVFFLRRPVRPPPAMADKSIAMLPFENLSRDPDNAYFATGIQDEILTRLAKIGALKVISRNSTQQYAARPGNLSEIARQLGVVNILEGSVQKAGDQVHINVQLIRAATDEHLWAESYTRKLENIFGVEGEVATAVAEALKAKLTGAEQSTLQQKPTNNPDAYDAYLRGLAYSLRPGVYKSDVLDAIKYFGQAVKLDPKFAVAWGWLARENARGYFYEAGDDFPALREAAKNAVSKVIELQPNLGEAHLAEGYFRLYCERNYDLAITSLEKAQQLAPANSQILEALAFVWRRKGEWQRSLDYYQQAKALDPRDVQLLGTEASLRWGLRQYPAVLKLGDRILEISPGNSVALEIKANAYQAEGNLPAAATLLSQLHLEPDSEDFDIQIQQWTYERRYADAVAVLKTAIERPNRPLRNSQKANYNRALALLQQFSGDVDGTRATWQRLVTEWEQFSRSQEVDWALMLAFAYAALGDKTKAFTLLDHAEALARAEGDPLMLNFFDENRAEIAVMTEDNNLAFAQLAISAQQPGGVTYGDLKFNPLWDPLRGDPRFEKIVASLAPKQ